MKAYHGDHALKAQVMKELAEHREADRLVKGQYWEDGKGCAVGCLVKSDDHELFSQRYGIPVELVYLNDRTFERLENHLSQQWPERFMGAINVGADLNAVHLKLRHWLLTDFIQLLSSDAGEIVASVNQCREAVDKVAQLLKRKIDGDVVTDKEWQTAGAAATYAADYAATYAGDFCDCYPDDCCDYCSGAWEAASNKLIELIKECEGTV